MIENLLSSIQSIIQVDPEEIDCIKNIFKLKSLKKGDYFVIEGQVSRYVGYLAKGVVHYYINDQGEHKTYEFAQENNFIGNYESFIPKTPSTKNIQALEDCEIFQLSYDDLQVFYKTVKQGERFGRIVIETVFIRTLESLTSLYTDTPEQRYTEFLKKHYELQQRLSQYYIASYVGVKPQSLSRIRKRIFKPN